MAKKREERAVTAIIVGQGKILDFIDGHTQRRDTPEEYVRQEIAKSIVREYRYAKADIEVELIVRVGTRKPRADLVVFPPDTAHKQEHAAIIIECKSSTIKATARKDGVEQLQSYMAACPNVAYGMWTNGIERFCYRRVEKGKRVSFEEVPDLPQSGQDESEQDAPASTSSSRPRQTRFSLPSGAATTTSQVIRDSRSRKPSGSYSS